MGDHRQLRPVVKNRDAGNLGEGHLVLSVLHVLSKSQQDHDHSFYTFLHLSSFSSLLSVIYCVLNLQSALSTWHTDAFHTFLFFLICFVPHAMTTRKKELPAPSCQGCKCTAKSVQRKDGVI